MRQLGGTLPHSLFAGLQQMCYVVMLNYCVIRVVLLESLQPFVTLGLVLSVMCYIRNGVLLLITAHSW